ncbi:DUF4304 domain-containing protein [Synoicihabitans lomoniglobus]|uniref:DUF4304 domain-containing protein n=1 Tax=Synoicihabitans lomoniglobus TaxID=2909285 RepID=A0AAF0CRE2_9BACT|nr:DUF4304 domain-containing protein [Opitutaceae bacterium LMO-M01]
MDAKDLTKAFDAELSGMGFRRKGKAWSNRGEAVNIFVGLQKSSYANQYFMNVGFELREIGSSEFPEERDCHVRGRASVLFAENKINLDELLNLGQECDANRLEHIRQFVTESLKPFFLENRTMDGLRRSYKAGRFSGLMIKKEARDLLDQR